VLCFELSRGSRWPPLNGADAPVSYEPSSRFESKFDRAETGVHDAHLYGSAVLWPLHLPCRRQPNRDLYPMH